MKDKQLAVPRRKTIRYSAADKIKVVKLFVEEGHQAKQLAKEFRIGESSLASWIKAYKEHGVKAFIGSPTADQLKNVGRVKGFLADQIIDHKAAHPSHGALRITQVFRRLLGLPVTVHQVRQTLASQSPPSTAAIRGKPKREPAPIRFFERKFPNELWHTDVMYFVMPNREKVFVIGYLDDYSRYVTGIDLFHRQTVGNTLDLLKKSCSDYAFPKEILTDGGRQFVSWTGNNQFGAYLRNHDVKHTVCRPQHPQTNGKMERFWRTLRQEFFDKAKIETFDELREQLQLYVKHYNFQRPHQGIGGLLPADRFFEIETDVKKQMAHRITENALEIALKGTIKKPFFMVGRVGDSNVAIMEQKGRLSMQIDGIPHPAGDPLTFDLTQALDKQMNMEHVTHGELNRDQVRNNGSAIPNNQAGVDSEGEMPSDSGDLDGEGDYQRSLPGSFSATSSSGTTRGVGAGGDVAGATATSEGTAGLGSDAGIIARPLDEVARTQVQSPGESASEAGLDAGGETRSSREEGSQGTCAENVNLWRMSGDVGDFSITIK